MHQMFADWYRLCTTGTEQNLTEGLLTARWKGIEKLTKDSDVIELVRLALGRPVADAVLSKFRAAFKEADATFQMAGNDLEIAVLAGSLLSQLLEEGSKGADKGALALICGTGIGMRVPQSADPFLGNAKSHLDRRLRAIRKQNEVAATAFANHKPGIEAFVAKIGANDPAATAEAAKSLLEAMQTNITASLKALSASVVELQRQSILRKEETDVLSWLTAGVSRDLDESFAELKLGASIVAGKELADLVRVPGVYASESILHGVLPIVKGRSVDKHVTLLSAVNAVDKNWRTRLTDAHANLPAVDLCPVIGAIKASISTSNPDGWVDAYRKSYDIDPGATVQPIELAVQIHRECLLVRA